MEKINDDISEFINDFSAFTPIDSIYKVDKEENKDLKEDNKAWKKLEQEDKKNRYSFKMALWSIYCTCFRFLGMVCYTFLI